MVSGLTGLTEKVDPPRALRGRYKCLMGQYLSANRLLTFSYVFSPGCMYNCVLVWLSKCFEPVKSLCIFRKGCWFPREKERPELFQARLSVYTVHCKLYSRKRVIGSLRSADGANLDNKLGKVECAQNEKFFSSWVHFTSFSSTFEHFTSPRGE